VRSPPRVNASKRNVKQRHPLCRLVLAQLVETGRIVAGDVLVEVRDVDRQRIAERGSGDPRKAAAK
jgi:hypothetical protein